MTTTQSSTRLIGIVLLALVALFVFPALLGMSGVFGMGPMGWGGGWMHDTWMHGGTGGSVPWWMWGMGLFGQLLVLAVLAGGGILLFRVVSGDNGGDDALEELRRAYARGDIDDEEFDRRQARLERERGRD
ncbi:SHOCT domain-containing protein [Haloferax sp. MBLA0076]|uniref:SHOCT domain-containing protein n=1 Tax=Haloferax litoreum TaxID=2666140 RepID=A0A6A8GGD0_9EURY|nr:MULTISPECIES: SHOCT domain-containing protein [Haloferax]KAB1193041.1 SHOCT domain-containing protein [Haloferax sp. CBA1148]MRX21532.1 SHOCT domain-containing protein [Haloferax litoreum]